TRICVDGQRYDVLNNDDGSINELVDAINEIEGHSASVGRCHADGGDPPAAPASSYVCYSTWEQDGGMVAPVSAIPGLLAGGGWQPYAVAGTAPDGPNLGTAYHLVCNLAAGLKPTGLLVDLNGYDGYFPTLLGMVGLF